MKGNGKKKKRVKEKKKIEEKEYLNKERRGSSRGFKGGWGSKDDFWGVGGEVIDSLS